MSRSLKKGPYCDPKLLILQNNIRSRTVKDAFEVYCHGIECAVLSHAVEHSACREGLLLKSSSLVYECLYRIDIPTELILSFAENGSSYRDCIPVPLYYRTYDSNISVLTCECSEIPFVNVVHS